MRYTIPALLMLTACGTKVTEENFAEVYGEVTCELLAECDAATYEAMGETCAESMTAAWEASVAMMEGLGCSIDYDYAQDCVDEAEGLTCDDYNSTEEADADSPCSLMFDCGGDTGM